jgi:hypothetical protein
MINCQDTERQAIVQAIAREASLEASMQLVERAVKAGDSELLPVACQLLGSALRAGIVGTVDVQDSLSMPSYLKSVKTVLKRGIPSKVSRKECRIEDCVTCFYESICERISVEKLIERSRALTDKLLVKR